MSLRWTSYVALEPPKCPPKGALKRKTANFPSNIALRLKKVCYKVSLCENCQRQSCKAFIGLTIHARIIGGGGGDPFYLKFWVKLVAMERSDSAVTRSEKSSINTNTKSTTCFRTSPRWTYRTLSLSPHRVAQKRSVQNLNSKLR